MTVGEAQEMTDYHDLKYGLSLTRRDFVKLTGLGIAAAAVPGYAAT